MKALEGRKDLEAAVRAKGRRWLRAAVACGVSLGFVLASAGQEPEEIEEPVAIEGAGILPVTTERRISIRGIEGEIAVRAGKPGELRFLSLSSADRRKELPVAIFVEGNRARIEPEKETSSAPRILQVAVPAEMEVSIESERSRVDVSGVQGGLEVRGSELRLDVRGVGGTVELSLVGSVAAIEAVSGDLSLRATGTELRAASVQGDGSLDADGGRIELRSWKGALSADLDGVAFVLEEVAGAVELKARGGSIALSGAASGGTLSLAGTPLVLERCRGDITIETDADVQFRDMQASFHLDSYGGSLRGFKNEGLLEARTRAATIALEGLSGPTRIAGEGLKVSLKTLAGETMLFTRTSEIAIEAVAGKLYVENEGGDVRIAQASAPVEIRSRGGSVRVAGLSAPVTIDSDGREVEVAWQTLAGGENSFIRNAGGDVRVVFPASGGCRVEAESEFGRIESDLPRLRLFDGGRQAQGFVGYASRPEVRIESSGDVFLLGPPTPEPAEEEGS